MSDALLAVQAASLTALEAHPVLSAQLTGIYDGPPPRAGFPYAAFGDALVSDWSAKGLTGREIRLPVTIWDDGEAPARLHELMGHVEDALAAIARDLDGWRIASNIFLRSLIARDPAGPWTGLVEQRIRVIAM